MGETYTYWFGNCCTKKGSYEIQAKIREPVIAEPLDFTSTNEFGTSFWNITSVELKYTLSSFFRNMIAIDEYKLYQNYDAYWLYVYGRRFISGETDREESYYDLLTDDNIKVQLLEKPFLIYNIATPFAAPNRPFITQHKQFQRYESYVTAEMQVQKEEQLQSYIDPKQGKRITATSEAYPLQFHPNSIYIWVAQKSSDRYSGKDRYTRVDSYAKIDRIRISYGNTSNILAQFDDQELFQMSLRNGLQDRTFLDWNATPKSITVPTDYYKNGGVLGFPCGTIIESVDGTNLKSTTTETSKLPYMNRYAGIGSVVRLVPGIDILTGDTTNPLIAGMHAYSQTIKIEADFVPLNAYDKTNYSLYVMFEYDGVCTINPNVCDLGMIAIDSWAQLKSTPKARVMRENYCYGAGGLGGAAARGAGFTKMAFRNAGVVSRGKGAARGGGNGGPLNTVGNLGKSAAVMSGGQIIPSEKLWQEYRTY